MRTLMLYVAAALVAFSTPAIGFGQCTGWIELNVRADQDAEKQQEACYAYLVSRVQGRAHQRHDGQKAVRISFGGDNNVTARCYKGSLIILASVHAKEELSCPALDQVRVLLGQVKTGS